MFTKIPRLALAILILGFALLLAPIGVFRVLGALALLCAFLYPIIQGAINEFLVRGPANRLEGDSHIHREYLSGRALNVVTIVFATLLAIDIFASRMVLAQGWGRTLIALLPGNVPTQSLTSSPSGVGTPSASKTMDPLVTPFFGRTPILPLLSPTINALVLTPTAPIPFPTPIPEAKTIFSTLARTGPSLNYSPSKLQIPKGATVLLYARNSDSNWLKIKYPSSGNDYYWIPAQSVTDTDIAISSLIVADGGPTPPLVRATPSPAPTASPTIAPGVYVSKVRMEPAQPTVNSRNEFTFYVTFSNTAVPVPLQWYVRIYRCEHAECSEDELKQNSSKGQTPKSRADLAIPMGTSELSSGPWTTTWTEGGNTCVWIAIPYYFVGSMPIQFTDITGGNVAYPFFYCKAP